MLIEWPPNRLHIIETFAENVMSLFPKNDDLAREFLEHDYADPLLAEVILALGRIRHMVSPHIHKRLDELCCELDGEHPKRTFDQTNLLLSAIKEEFSRSPKQNMRRAIATYISRAMNPHLPKNAWEKNPEMFASLFVTSLFDVLQVQKRQRTTSPQENTDEPTDPNFGTPSRIQ